MSDTISSLLQRIGTMRDDDVIGVDGEQMRKHVHAALVLLADVREAAEAILRLHSEEYADYCQECRIRMASCPSKINAQAILGVVGEQTTTKDHT